MACRCLLWPRATGTAVRVRQGTRVKGVGAPCAPPFAGSVLGGGSARGFGLVPESQLGPSQPRRAPPLPLPGAGNCHRLMDALEAMLGELGVAWLVLPSMNKVGWVGAGQLNPNKYLKLVSIL